MLFERAVRPAETRGRGLMAMGSAASGDASPDSGARGGGRSMSGDSQNLEDLISDLDERAGEEGSLDVGGVIDAFGRRTFGPLLVVPALIAFTPAGAVPGAPAVIAVLIVLVAVQQLFGRSSPWIPGTLRERGIGEDAWARASQRLRPWAARVDAVIEPRLGWLTRGAMSYVVSLLAIGLALSMFPLGFVPFAVMVPAAGIVTLGLAMMAHDGLLAIVGVIASAASGYLVVVAIG